MFGFFKRLLGLKNDGKLHPESSFIVNYDDSCISVINYDKKNDSIHWSELENVTILTNDSGPWGTDFWWVLGTNSKEIAIPEGATGEAELGNRIRELPGFNYQEFFKAVTSTDNAVFHCWKKK